VKTVRELSVAGPCTTLGLVLRETARSIGYRDRRGTSKFISKRWAVHTEPCPSCPEKRASRPNKERSPACAGEPYAPSPCIVRTGSGMFAAMMEALALECPSPMATALGIFLTVMVVGGANAGPDGKDVPRIAFFGFEFVNTSLEPTARAEVERIRMLDDFLRQKLMASSRFEIVDIPPEAAKEIASGPAISNCNGCQRKFAQRIGANWAAWGTVQKVSNLILNINLYIEDVGSGKMQFVRSVDIRGNTDESWWRGLIICCAIICCGSPDSRAGSRTI
jgi:hypothetical protein